MQTLAWVMFGSALGGGARFLVSLSLVRFALQWPLATWVVNTVGCFLMGFLAVLPQVARGPNDLRLFLTTGILGGFTTYSAFNQEMLQLYSQRSVGSAFVYGGLTVSVCLLSSVFGMFCSKLWA
jgi:fluoride exporter